MDRLRQNIWWLFGLAASFSVILLSAVAAYAWQLNYERIRYDLINSHKLAEGYYLEKIQRLETAFRLLKEKDGQGAQFESSLITMLLDEIVEYERRQDPHFFDGELIVDEKLLADKNSNTIFAKNTFYYKTKERWITPFCYRFKQSDYGCFAVDHNDLAGPLKPTSDRDNVFYLISTLDFWLIYNSFINEDNSHWYGQNMLTGDLRGFIQLHSDTIKQNTGMSMVELLASGRSHTYQQILRTGDKALITLGRVPGYNFFFASGFRYPDIWRQFLDHIYGMALLLVTFNLVLFILFRRYDTINERHRQVLKHKSMHDDLTDLLTRRASETFFVEQQPLTGPHVMAALTIDEFHLINERFGHNVGDSLLKYAASNLKKYCGHNRQLLRDNGPDFIMILPGQDTEKTVEWISSFITKMAKPLQIEDVTLRLTFSAGIFDGNLSEISYREALKRVDLALWKAKSTLDHIYTYTEETHHQVIQRILVREQLEYGLDNREFYAAYQPQIDSQTRIMTGVEVLARWNNATLGSIPPDLFIDVAEESGLIIDLGNLIMSIALEEMAEVMNETGEIFSVSINFSLNQFYNTNIFQEINSMVEAVDFPSELLTVEITESTFASKMDITREILSKLHVKGYQVSLDDFGTGYSSLSMLSKLPIDEIKIDKSFINRIHQSESDYLLVKNIIAIGTTLGLKVVAEGVEHDVQAEILGKTNCHTIQGYLYSKPLQKDELKTYISNIRTT